MERPSPLINDNQSAIDSNKIQQKGKYWGILDETDAFPYINKIFKIPLFVNLFPYFRKNHSWERSTSGPDAGS